MASVTGTTAQWRAHVNTCSRRPGDFWVEPGVIDFGGCVKVTFAINMFEFVWCIYLFAII